MREFFKKVWKRIEPIAIDFVVICTILFSLSAITILLHKLPLSEEQIKLVEFIDFYAAIILILLFVCSTIIRLTHQEWKEITNDEQEKQTESSVLEVKKNDKSDALPNERAVPPLPTKKFSQRRKR